ncbi:MAG: peptide chain release factor N(5)-glutamine methyltransferase [Candidatus Moranbacteria bacterium]|nr:peptide chain release factor N(5)-glutamine methyltransferase [Candidatus Moranbacteria bacterium]
MITIKDILDKYHNQIDCLDLEILIANSLGKTREFVLIHPEHKPTKSQISKLESQISRRAQGEPVAYIVGHKEFYGLDFEVNKHTLVPRPETELMVEQVLSSVINHHDKINVIDVGTGSGNIIISIANLDSRLRGNDKIEFYAIDISEDALKIAKQNAKQNGVGGKIKFLHGSLLEPILKKCSMLHDPCSMIITANLPYLSKEVYDSTPVDVKKFEPKTALYSPEAGLQHYRKLLEQVKNQVIGHQSSVILFLEFSPEQKTSLSKLIKSILPQAEISFTKDLAGKWRICKVTIHTSPSP